MNKAIKERRDKEKQDIKAIREHEAKLQKKEGSSSTECGSGNMEEPGDSDFVFKSKADAASSGGTPKKKRSRVTFADSVAVSERAATTSERRVDELAE